MKGVCRLVQGKGLVGGSVVTVAPGTGSFRLAAG
jgi:hypothetical protein